MRANALRIGNYVNIEGDVVKVKEIYEKSIHYANSEYESFATEDFIQPIELTEEILVKIGFEKFVKSFRMELSGCRLDYFIDKTLYIYKKHTNCCLIKDLEIKCEYIHQLQNSFFLLTGKELEVEL
jgi:hypothetical protein